MKIAPTPESRIQVLNCSPESKAGEYVLYWMVANRRLTWNYSLQRACEWAAKLQKPLLIFEALRIDYRWASDRLHRFVLQGMHDNRAACQQLPVYYYSYVEPERHHSHGLFEALAARASVIVTDDFPCFFIPSLLKVATRHTHSRFEAIDSNGLLPMRAADREFTTAHAFRRFLQKVLPLHLQEFPVKNPLARCSLPQLESLPAEIHSRWPAATDDTLLAASESLAKLDIDHHVPAASFHGGAVAAGETLAQFMKQRLYRYDTDRNSPDDSAASGLSPYLHFGHISVHEIFAQVTAAEEWSLEQQTATPSGSREGWWGMSPHAESFLDELITWRELGYNMCSRRSDYDRYGSLPEWARKTLEKHAADPREFHYTLEEFERAETHDEVWNAAQRQLVREGRMHNYLRMLWGKKILEWTRSPQEALRFMIELNNKYAVDGRNPNSYTGIFWVLGRYDRAWGPERPIYGTVRYMTSESTRRKLKLKEYLRRYRAR